MSEYIFLTETGKRDNNEDSFGNYKKEFFLVCDGLGGRPAGEVASKIAVETAISIYKSSDKKDNNKLLDEIFRKANQEIFRKAKENPKNLGMGSTMVVVILNTNSIVIGNIGDCRAYLYASNSLRQITKDDRDLMGYLIKALGLDEEVKPKVTVEGVKKGDLILLCSDGLFDFVKDKVIGEIMGSKADLKYKAKGLIDAALEFGSTDNITVGLIGV